MKSRAVGGSVNWVRLAVRVVVIAAVVAPAANLVYIQPSRSSAGAGLAPDFAMFYTAAHLAAAGEWEDVYDVAAFRDAFVLTTGDMAPLGGPAFGYPPPLAQVLEPASRFPLGVAAIGFLAGSAALSFLALKRLGLGLKGVALVTFSNPGLLAFWFGQNSYLSLAIVAASFALITGGRRFVGGVVLGCLLFKPQLLMVVGLMFLLAPRRYRAVIGGAAVSVTILTAVSFAISPEAWFEFPEGLRQLTASADNLYRSLRFGAIDFAYLLLGEDNPLSPVLAAVLVTAGIVAFLIVRSKHRPDTSIELAMGVALAMWINPWGSVYEWVLLAVPALLLVRSGKLSQTRGALIFGCFGILATVSGGIAARGVMADGTGLQLATPAFVVAVYFAFTDPVARPRILVGADQ